MVVRHLLPPTGMSHPYDPAASKSFTCGYLRNAAASPLPWVALCVPSSCSNFRYGIGHFKQGYGDGSGLSGVMATERIELGRYCRPKLGALQSRIRSV